MLGKEATRPRAAGDMAPAADAERAQRAQQALARRVRNGFFFETEALRESLETARETLETGAALLIEGESGAGKTFFLSRLARTGTTVCHIELRHPLGQAALCARVARAFGAAGDAAREPHALAAHVAARSGGATPLILIDDAHRLSSFALRALLSLRAEVQRLGGRIGLAVSSPPQELNRYLAVLPSFAAYREAFAKHALPRLTREETRDYLRLAFDTADGDGETFDDARIGVLQRVSGGLPGQINRAAAEMLRGGRPSRYRRRQHTSLRLARGLKPGKRWAMPAGLTLGVIASGYLAWAVLFGTPADPRSGEADTFAAPAVIEIPPAGAVEPTFAGLPAQETASTDAPSAAAAEPQPIPRAAEQSPSPSRTSSGPAAVSPVVPADVPAAASAGASAGSSRPASDLSRLSDRDWLMAQDPARYTIQLASAPSQEKAAEFIGKHALQGRTVAVEAVRGTSSYYIVLYNSYASNADAARGIESLPSVLRKNDPFARRIASVRAMMKEG